MPSPFPGMDPYLEDRSLWPDVHSSLITYIREALQPLIRPKYIARIGERIQLAEVRHSYIPDVLLVHRLREPVPTLTLPEPLVADEPQMTRVVDEARREPYIEIVYRETGDVVTLIEVLSPANKEGEGYEQYAAKQQELLDTPANLVEIDLLGHGKRSPLGQRTRAAAPPDWRYLITISRAGRRGVEFYAVPLHERLPRCRIPLRPPDPDAVLDLPTVFTRCYDVGGYDLLIDYHEPPPVPLQPEESIWMDELLQEKGLRESLP